MKKSILLLLIFLPLLAKTQAHLGATEQDIRELHSDKTFITGYTKAGEKYISTDFDYGNFTYYFNDTTHLSYLCIQIPKDMISLNALVQLYNTKYVVTSNTSWRAYLEGGGMLYIALRYLDEDKIYVFYYTPTY